MTGEQSQATVFERGSNVHEYWLAHAEGFHVVSRRKPRDRVDHVVVDRELGSATALVVRRKRGRRAKRIPVMWVSAVDPFERLLYLTPKRRAHTAAERLRPHAVDAAGAAWRAQVAAVDWLRPRALAAVRRARFDCVRAAVWLRPRLVEAARRAAVASVRGYRASSAGLQAAYAWFRPRAAAALQDNRLRVARGAASGLARAADAAAHVRRDRRSARVLRRRQARDSRPARGKGATRR